jgi:beta-glucosidase
MQCLLHFCARALPQQWYTIPKIIKERTILQGMTSQYDIGLFVHSRPHTRLPEPLRFPPGFLWGTATSAHQVEGQNTNNQWWVWEQQGRCWHGDVSGDACGWWRDAEGDLDRAAALGTNAHRMSIEWSRIEPEEGRFDREAIRRYREIIGGIVRRGMTPMITLHHFTNPLWVEAKGAWLNAKTPRWFARFVAYAVEELGDLCNLWCTVNEPTVYAALSYLQGVWPPGRRNILQALRVFGNLMRGHELAAQTVHRQHPAHRVGIVHHKRILDPASPAGHDVLTTVMYDYLVNGLVLRRLRETSDFFGLNYYSRDHIAFDLRRPYHLFIRRFTPPYVEQSDAGMLGTFGEIYPNGLYRALKRAYRWLKLPIYVTETGLPDEDDNQRPRFLLNHLESVYRAIQEGIDVRGVFIWSLVDNFEWAEGWGLRFGLYALDERTGERRMRPSAALYAIIARANAIPAPGAL